MVEGPDCSLALINAIKEAAYLTGEYVTTAGLMWRAGSES
jgi:hypothetical protein